MQNNENTLAQPKKRQILQLSRIQAIKTLYNENVQRVNTAKTVYGKKAFVQFETTDKARDLATKIGML